MGGASILLIITGGIAAYKSLDLIRRLRERDVTVRCVLTKGGEQFVTPLSVAALSENKVYQEIFSLTDEAEMGHIRLSRESDLVVVAPCTADMMAKMATGQADDLASTVLLATDKPVLIAPAMNTMMWQHPATQRNLATLQGDGIHVVGPGAGELACGEVGAGRMSEVPEIISAIEDILGAPEKPLAGKKVIVTSGPTHEPIDPVRYIANRSSGKQGHAIAEALASLGAETILVSGPVHLPDPTGVQVVPVESAKDMYAAVHDHLPCDVAVFAAAVADWRVDNAAETKLKKTVEGIPTLSLTENPDILKAISNHDDHRPTLVVGFAAETGDLVEKATAKRARKGCDWIVANDVSPDQGIFGGDHNLVQLITDAGAEPWEKADKATVAAELAKRIADHLKDS